MKTMQYDIGLTFGIEAAVGQFITGYEPGSQYVPSAEENYRFDKSVLRDLMVWWNMNLSGNNKDGMYLFGPTGAGKSAALVNFCALLNIPMYEKTIYEGMEFDVLMGRTEIVGGDTVFSMVLFHWRWVQKMNLEYLCSMRLTEQMMQS